MPLPTDFLELLHGKTDEKLYEEIAHPDDFLPEAVSAAREELGKRDLPPERVAHLETTAQSQIAADEPKASQRLGWGMRVFIFVFAGLLTGVFAAIYYENKGYKRKAREAWVTLAISLAAHALLGMLIF